MKKALIYVFIIFFCISCGKSKPDLTVKAKLFHTFDSTNSDNTIKRRSKVDLTLLNNSNRTISFWTMSCSWTDNWLINIRNKYFKLKSCDKNFPKIVEIKPKDSLVYHAIITSQIKLPIGNYDTVRFGFIFVDTVMCKTQHDFDDILKNRSNQNKIIWSNPLFLIKDGCQNLFINNIQFVKYKQNFYSPSFSYPLIYSDSQPDLEGTFLLRSPIDKYQISDNYINISLRYGGGCDHTYIHFMADTSNASKGADINIYFAFKSYDGCKAILRANFNIDLKNLRKKYPSNRIKCDFIKNRKYIDSNDY